MAQFLGWETYDLPWFCKYCNEHFEEEDKHEHENCIDNTNNDDNGVCQESSPRSHQRN